MRSRIAALVAVLALLSALTTAAAQARPNGAVVNSSVAAFVGEYGGVSLTIGRNGVYLLFVSLDDPAGEYAARITDAAVLDQGVVVVAPSFIHGPGPLATVVRKGRSTTLFGEGDFIFTEYVDFPGASRFPIFIPAGKVLTVQKLTPNTDSNITLGFTELMR